MRSGISGWFGGGWFGRGRTRALLSLGVVAALGAVGTSAYWTDTATVTGGTITSGSMDLQVQSPDSTSVWRQVGLGGAPYADSTFAIPNLTPGESQAFNFAARNIGTPPFDYAATITQSGTWTFVANPIQVRFYGAGARINSNTSTYPRTGTCTGTPLGAGAVTVTAGNTTVIPSRRLNAGAQEMLCVVVSMIPTADNANQGRTGSLRVDFSANQATS